MWFPLRVVLHVALTVLFILSEFWISIVGAAAPARLVLGIYATVLSLGFAVRAVALSRQWAAPASCRSASPSGWSCWPRSRCSRRPAREPEDRLADGEPAGFLRYIWLVPTATAAVLVFGAVETGGFALFPVYGNRIGYSEADAALLLSMIGLGNVILQIPLGMLSDRIGDRRILLVACAVVGLAGMLAAAVVRHQLARHRGRAVRLGRRRRGALHRSALRISAPGSPAASLPRPMPPSCSATASACCSARR